MSKEATAKTLLCELGKILADRGMLGMAAGSLSVRVDKRLLVTPAGVSASLLRPEQVQELSGSHPLGGLLRSAYEVRSDVGAIFWVRPIATTALSIAGISPAQCLLPFSVGSLGGEVEPTLFGSQRLLELVRRFDVVLLERFGALVLGASAEDAFARAEALEQCSQITQTTRSFSLTPLPKHQLDHKIARGNALQLTAQKECTGCGGCGQSKGAESESALAATVAAVFAQKPKSEEPVPFTLPPGRRATCGEAWWLEPEKK